MIDASNFGDDDYVQISVIKKYRAKKENSKKTNYSFFKITLRKDISNEVKKWVIDNFESIKDKKVIEYNPSVELENLEKINLKDLSVWEEFEKNAFAGLNLKEIKLKEIKNHAVGLVIFIKKGSSVFGQIRKIPPGYILSKGLFYLLHFDGTKFSDLKEEKGIKLDKKADFIFYSNGEKSEGIIINKDNFHFLFDVWEEYRKKALENSKSIKLFNESDCFSSMCNIINEDRQIQRMLINPVVEKHLNETSYDDLIKIKKKAPNLNFELNEPEKDFILPFGKEKEAIRDLIKAVSGRFGFTINQKHLVENTGVRRFLE